MPNNKDDMPNWHRFVNQVLGAESVNKKGKPVKKKKVGKNKLWEKN